MGSTTALKILILKTLSKLDDRILLMALHTNPRFQTFSLDPLSRMLWRSLQTPLQGPDLMLATPPEACEEKDLTQGRASTSESILIISKQGLNKWY